MERKDFIIVAHHLLSLHVTKVSPRSNKLPDALQWKAIQNIDRLFGRAKKLNRCDDFRICLRWCYHQQTTNNVKTTTQFFLSFEYILVVIVVGFFFRATVLIGGYRFWCSFLSLLFFSGQTFCFRTR